MKRKKKKRRKREEGKRKKKKQKSKGSRKRKRKTTITMTGRSNKEEKMKGIYKGCGVDTSSAFKACRRHVCALTAACKAGRGQHRAGSSQDHAEANGVAAAVAVWGANSGKTTERKKEEIKKGDKKTKTKQNMTF